MIPESRLETLLEQAGNWQKMKCVYHNSFDDQNDSLFSNHYCDR